MPVLPKRTPAPRAAVHPARSGALAAGADPVATYLGSLRLGRGRRAMAMALDQFAVLVTHGVTTAGADLDWSQIGSTQIAHARIVWSKRYSPAGAKLRLAAVRGCLRAAWRLGIIGAEQFQRAMDVPPIRAVSRPQRRALTAQELDALFAACMRQGAATGARDAALFVCLRAGLRAGELAALNQADYVVGPALDTIRVRESIRGRVRLAYVSRQSGRHVDRWRSVRGNTPGPLFRGLGPRFGRLAPQTIASICRRWAHAAGIAAFNTQDLRRTTATELYRAGADLTTIQALLGLRSMHAAQRYVRRHDREAAKRQAAALLDSGRVHQVVAAKIASRSRRRDTDVEASRARRRIVSIGPRGGRP